MISPSAAIVPSGYVYRLECGLDTSPVVVLHRDVAVDDGVPGCLRCAANVDLIHVSWRHAGPSFLEAGLEDCHRADEWLGVFADPPVMDQADRDRVQVVELVATFTTGGDELGSLEHVEVIHHAEARHVGQDLAQFSQGAAVAIEECIQQGPASRVVECLEDRVIHDEDYM